MKTKEELVCVPILGGRYLVREDDKIFSLFFKNRSTFRLRDHPLELKQGTTPKGYLNAVLDGKTVKVHRVVAECFLHDYTKNLQVNHIDGDKKNNDYRNLEMCDASKNQKHRCWKLGKIKRYKIKEEFLDEIVDLFLNGENQKTISEKYGVTHSAVCSVLVSLFDNRDSEYAERFKDRLLLAYSRPERYYLKRHKIAKEALEKIKGMG